LNSNSRRWQNLPINVLVAQIASRCGKNRKNAPQSSRANETSLLENAEMIASVEIMATEIEIITADIAVVRLKTQEMREVVDEIEIESVEGEILGTQENHGALEKDAMIEATDVIGIERMELGMEEGIGETEVSTLTIHLCWFIASDLTRKKLEEVETGHAIDQDLHRRREDEAEVRGENGNQKVGGKRRLYLYPRLRRSSRRAERLRHL